MFYGVGCEKCSSMTIAKVLNILHDDIRFKIKEARDAAHRLYLNKASGIIIDEEQYIPYIEDMSVDLNDITRTLLREFVIEKKSYDELKKLHKISRAKISATITEGIRKIDFYRFGILRVSEKYSKEEYEIALQDKKFTEEDRDIIRYILKTGFREEAIMNFKSTKQKVDNLMSKFFSLCYSAKVSNVSIDITDIEREVNAYISESVLTNNEIQFDIRHSTKQEVIEIIRKYRGELSTKTVNTLSKLYGIMPRELMSGSEQMKVLRFLSELNVKQKVLSLRIVA